MIALHLEGGTIAEARNEAARKARGEWLLHLDADDELAPGYLAAMRAAAEALYEPLRATLCGRPEHGGLQIGPCPYCGWEKLTRHSPALLVPSVQYVHPNGCEEKPRIPNEGQWPEVNIACIGTLVPRSLFEHVGGFRDYQPYEDYELFLRCERAGARLHLVRTATYRAFVHPQSAHRRPDGRRHRADLHQRILAEREAALRAGRG